MSYTYEDIALTYDINTASYNGDIVLPPTPYPIKPSMNVSDYKPSLNVDTSKPPLVV